MTLRHLPRLALCCAALLPFAALAQRTPDSVTDAEIAAFQQHFEPDCVARGLERKSPEAYVRHFCGCTSTVLKKRLAHADWQRLIAGWANGSQDEMKAIVGANADELQACKAMAP